MNLHRLDGCSPTPLASYLKALGVLRLVAEQLDPEARAWWEGERFVLATTCSAPDLLRFFLDGYSPTPLVSPWNKGSGFFYDGDPALTAAESSEASRFELLRVGVRDARLQLRRLSEADQRVREIKEKSKSKSLSAAERSALRASDEYKKMLADAERVFKTLKNVLMPNLKVSWRGPHRQWVDAALVLEDDGQAKFPALLGTGGNDGRLDFTNNYLQRLTELFDFAALTGSARPSTGRCFRSALWGLADAGITQSVSVGQFAPGDAGGANATTGPFGDPRMNPADFVLMMEGAVLFASAATRRMDVHRSARASAPFATASHPAGYASAAVSDEDGRGEQWMPLWQNPATLV